MRIALIDGDEVAYKIASSYETKYYGVIKDDILLSKFKHKQDAIEFIENEENLEIKIIKEFKNLSTLEKDIIDAISTIKINSSSSDIRICLSTEYNFRTELATLLTYKGNRVSEERVEYFDLVRNKIRELFYNETFLKYGLEADDILAYLQTKYLRNKLIYPETIICSSDKDLRTVPGLNYNIRTGKIKDISEEEAKYNFYYQLLIGDSTDNIPSPYGIGPVLAKKVLGSIEDKTDNNYYQTIREVYLDYLNRKDKEDNYKTKWYLGQDVDDVLWEIGNLLYMHRTLDLEERWNPDYEKEKESET